MILRKRDRGERGMTLVELLTAMTLLAALGAMIVQLMRNSFDLYSSGERRGEFAANAVVVMDRLEDDLKNVVAGDGGRFVAEARGGAGVGSPALLLRLIRTPPDGEASHPTLRSSGTVAESESAYTGRDPGLADRGRIRPSSNRIEVCYALIQDQNSEDGLLTLYRGERAPVLEPGSTFFDPEHPEPDAAWVRTHLTPIAAGVLDLKLLFRLPNDDDWADAAVLEGQSDAARRYGTWDSTRGLISSDVFAYGAGAASLHDERDDIYPAHVRILLVVGRPGRPDARVGRRLVAGATELTVDRAERLPRATDEDRFVKIGAEWLEIASNEPWGANAARGRRRTTSAPLIESTTPVFVGKTFRKTVELPPSSLRPTEAAPR